MTLQDQIQIIKSALEINLSENAYEHTGIKRLLKTEAKKRGFDVDPVEAFNMISHMPDGLEPKENWWYFDREGWICRRNALKRMIAEKEMTLQAKQGHS